jgi:cytochrome oxidase Cu insertion factor (SCO1/SenC/PrrC family)
MPKRRALKLSIPASMAALIGAMLLSLPVTAQSQPRQKIDLSKLGPQVGERVPDFSLKDQNGKTWTLQSIMGPKGAMLVFERSADW